MKPLEQRTLMRYFDEELSPAEAAQVEEELLASPEGARLLADFETLGELVQESALERSQPADDLADGVMARIELERRPDERGERAAGPAPAPVYPLPSAAEPVLPDFRKRFVRLSLVMAAAAGVGLALSRSPGRPPHADLGQGAPPSASVVFQAAPTALASVGGPGQREVASAAAIEAVDFGSHAGSIFLVLEGDETTPVVWLVDEPASSLGRMEPL
jgi:hypothetical protein